MQFDLRLMFDDTLEKSASFEKKATISPLVVQLLTTAGLLGGLGALKYKATRANENYNVATDYGKNTILPGSGVSDAALLGTLGMIGGGIANGYFSSRQKRDEDENRKKEILHDIITGMALGGVSGYGIGKM